MVEAASRIWVHSPVIYFIVIWTFVAVVCSIRGWKAFAIFFGSTAAILVASMFYVDSLPDLGGDWPRDEAFIWWGACVYAALGFIPCALIAGIAEARRERALNLEGVE